MTTQPWTPGQAAYEEDVRRKPLYHDGTPRKRWDELDEIIQWSWGRILPCGGMTVGDET